MLWDHAEVHSPFLSGACDGADVGRGLESKLLDTRFHTVLIFDLWQALYHLHTFLGIYHNDIKLPNLLLSECGHTKLVDFGSAQWQTAEAGQVNGKPNYLALGAPTTTEYLGCRAETGAGRDAFAAGLCMWRLQKHSHKGHPFFSEAELSTHQAFVARCSTEKDTGSQGPQLWRWHTYKMIGSLSEKIWARHITTNPLYEAPLDSLLAGTVPPLSTKPPTPEERAELRQALAGSARQGRLEAFVLANVPGKIEPTLHEEPDEEA